MGLGNPHLRLVCAHDIAERMNTILAKPQEISAGGVIAKQPSKYHFSTQNNKAAR